MVETSQNFVGITKDGYKVFDRKDSHFHAECGITKAFLKSALKQVKVEGEWFRKEEIHFEEPIGVSTCVETTQEDEVVMVYRKGHEGQTPMVKGREPELCKTLTIIIRKDHGCDSRRYTLITCFVGEGNNKEPWEKSIQTEEERRQCEEYWSNHAIIYNPELIDWERM